MKRSELDKIFTDKVMEYMNKGYIIHTRTFNGSDGTLRVDLIKGKDFIRVYLHKQFDTMNLIVGHKILNKRELNDDIVWRDNLENIEEKVFYTVEYDKWYADKEEYDAIKEVRKKRRIGRKYPWENDEVLVNQDKAKEIIFPFMKRQYRCKTIKPSDILDVRKCDYDGRMRYFVRAKGNRYFLG